MPTWCSVALEGLEDPFSVGLEHLLLKVISGPWSHSPGNLRLLAQKEGLPDFCAHTEPWGPGPSLRDPCVNPCPPHTQLEEAQKQRQERLVAGQQQILQQLSEEEPKVRP